jgi:NAD(P)-dependent dehydrogenase (short-subunit alcohol dehydrogenase family)
MKTVILFGASSTIAQAYIAHLAKQPLAYNVICISRSIKQSSSNSQITINYHQTDYSPESLHKIVANISKQSIELSQVIIFNGQLHNLDAMPEKKIEEINTAYFNQLMQSNALIPMLCLQSIMPLLSHKTHCTISALSARVGSINDNQLGGWYTYRASKAALNMLFKSAAVEIARRAKNSKLILFHPGTTNSALSKPFQKNVAPGKLFTAQFVAKQLFELTNNNPDLVLNGQPDYIDWQGKSIPW